MARPAKITRWRSGQWTIGKYTEASLTTALTGTHNDLTYTATDNGTAGNSVTVTYAVAGNNTPLTVSVTGTAITVNVATSGAAAPLSTAAQVRDAVRASTAARALVNVDLATGNDGTGVVTALSATALSGGAAGAIGVGGVRWGRKRERGNNNLG
jgi:hypothetical protein